MQNAYASCQLTHVMGKLSWAPGVLVRVPELGLSLHARFSLAVSMILAIAGAACSGSGASTVCSIPASANTYGDGSTGCHAEPDEQNCTVTNGASIFQDGAVENGTKTCTSSCPPGQFYLACAGPPGSVGPAPSPDPSLNCRVAGGPTGGGYCCECAT
jgi:hypothetical protein